MRQDKVRRPGAAAIEGAVVYSALFVLLFGLLVGGLGVFRYQQVACLAREAARYAAVHGADWQSDQKQQALNQQQILQQAVLPVASGLPASQFAIQMQLVDGASGAAADWDASSQAVTTTAANGQTVTNRVRVCLGYTWVPGFLLTSPVNLQSISEVPMSY